ncbi:hypothetical protein [Teichococcus deserti]|uniref:hypothetical protein n=1 Tax=Teichococcus deserti TaxID=1817963 RepID=UPI001A9705F5|nr:hypothetical protein [Pseudoroseomonas deserti]
MNQSVTAIQMELDTVRRAESSHRQFLDNPPAWTPAKKMRAHREALRELGERRVELSRSLAAAGRQEHGR